MNSVLVLLSTYNGERYLREQLDSLYAQEEVELQILVRDDGSSDTTSEIINEYKQKKGRLTIYYDDNVGANYNFFKLIEYAVTDMPKYDYYAFCDQDDVWDSDKLEIAINKIASVKRPALYCSDTQLVDSDLHILGNGGIEAEGTFLESLISNPVTGCTMVFNNALRDLVIQYQPNTIYMHDWWIYKICMAVDGYFFFDKIPHIRYRQHGSNVIGGQDNKKKNVKRHFIRVFSPKDGVRYIDAKELYKGYINQIGEKNKSILEMVVHYKDSIKDTLKLAFSKELAIKSCYSLWVFRIADLLRKF